MKDKEEKKPLSRGLTFCCWRRDWRFGDGGVAAKETVTADVAAADVAGDRLSGTAGSTSIGIS